MSKNQAGSNCQIAVLGSINMDMTSRLVSLPKAGETVHATDFSIGLGGKGANQAVAASRMGIKISLAGFVGDDAFGKEALEHLQKTSIDLSYVYENKQAMTGIASIQINQAGENIIIVSGGANMAMLAEDVLRFKPLLTQSKVLMLQCEVPMDVIIKAAEIAHDAGNLVILDPAPAPDHLPDALYPLLYCITPNETETEKLTGIRPIDKDSARKAANILLARGVKIAIIKLGRHGVCYFSQEKSGFMPPFQVNMVDSVAAGDSFNGGLANGLAKGLSLAQSIRLAAACGALATTKKGAADAAPHLAEAEDLMQVQSHIESENLS